MPDRHTIHRTAALFAVKHTFRLCRKANGFYYLKDNHGADVDTPAWGGDTAAGAVRMMRRHVRLNLSAARACMPLAFMTRAAPTLDRRTVSA